MRGDTGNMAVGKRRNASSRPVGQSPHKDMILIRPYDPDDEQQQAVQEAWGMLRARGDIAPLQTLGIARPGADMRAAFRNKHRLKQNVKALQDTIRRYTADPDRNPDPAGEGMKQLRRELAMYKRALGEAVKVIERLPDVKPKGVPD